MYIFFEQPEALFTGIKDLRELNSLHFFPLQNTVFQGFSVQQILVFCGNTRFDLLDKEKFFDGSVFPVVVAFTQINAVFAINQKTVDHGHIGKIVFS